MVLLLGLEPSTSQGVAAMVVDFDDDPSANTRSIEPNVQVAGGEIFSHPAIILILMVLRMFGFLLLWKVYKIASAAYESFNRNYTDLAVLESLVDEDPRTAEHSESIE